MADLAFVTEDKTHNSVSVTTAMLVRKGHAVTVYNRASVTAGNLSAYAAILAQRVAVGAGTLAGQLSAYLSTYGIPVLVGGVPAAVTGSTTTDLATLIGLCDGAASQSGQDEADASVIVSAFADHAVTCGLEPGLGLYVRAADDFGGWIPSARSHAGRALLRNAAGNPVLTACDAVGADGAKVGGGYFGARCGFVGWLYGLNDYGKDGAALIDAAINWAVGSAAAQYPVGMSGRHVFATDAFALDALIAYRGSSIDWTASLPGGGGRVDVYGTIDNGLTWSAIASAGDAFPFLTAGQDMAGVRARLRFDMTTSTAASSPSVGLIDLSFDGQGPPIRKLPVSPSTLAPDGWLDQGLVTFLTGANAGLSREVAAWSAAPRRLRVFEPFPFAIEIGDVFQVYPGCDKTISTCVEKFDNGPNFRGEPYKPSQQAVYRNPNV